MNMIESLIVPPQSGAAVRVPEGAALRITDVDGQQVSDMFAVFADMSDHLSARTSRAASWRLFPRVGEPFVSMNYRPMFLFEEDTSPGPHDLLAPPCSAEMYALLGFEGYHPSCSDNFRTAADSIGWHPEAVPDPVDWFQNTPVDSTGSMSALPALTQPGDSVTLRALADMFVIVTACSMDLPGKMINGAACSAIGVEVLR
ncbi:MAG: urea carboxylase-associated family protein [Candidatus Nanopelagicales bacterium]